MINVVKKLLPFLLVFIVINKIFDLNMGYGLIIAALLCELVIISMFSRAVYLTIKRRDKGAPLAFWPSISSILSEMLNPQAAHIVVTELRVIANAIAALCFVPLKKVSSPRDFLLLPASNYRMVFALLLFGFIAEVPLVHFFIGKIMDPSKAKDILQGVLLFFNIYGLIWFVGDYRMLKTAVVRVKDDKVEFEISIRWNGQIPLEKIKQIVPCTYEFKSRAFAAPGEKIQKKPADEAFLGLMKEPLNLTLELHEPVPLATFFGITRNYKKVHLLVERPLELQNLITAKLSELTTSQTEKA